MQGRVLIDPPETLDTYGPSMLLRFFLRAGDWTYGSFADDLALFHRNGVVSTETIADWARNDTVTQKYRYALFSLLLDRCSAPRARAWHDAFVAVWAAHDARRFQARRCQSRRVA